MGFYDGFNKPNVTRRNGEGGNTIAAGDYGAVMVARCKHHQGFFGEKFIVEVVVLEDGRGEEADKADSIVSKGYRLDGNYGHLGYGEVMGFLGIAHDIPDSKTKGTDWGKLAADAVERNALEGRILACTVRKKDTGKEHPQTIVSWRLPDPDVLKRVQSRVDAAKEQYASAGGGGDEDGPPSLGGKQEDESPPPIAPAFPPAGWKVHPGDASYYYKGKLLKKEHELRAMVAAGTA